MRSKKLFHKLKLFFNHKKQQEEKRRLELKIALKQLKEELEQLNNEEERAQLEEKISILETQRRKGIDKLRNPEV